MAKKNLIQLAKKNNTNKKTTNNKTTTVNNSSTNDSNILELDPKTTINKLLDDVSLTTTISNENKTVDEPTKEVNKGSLEWLGEQIDLLTNENEKLRTELGNSNTFSELESFKKKIINQFNEYQTNYLKFAPQNRHLTTVNLGLVINNLVKDFSFLKNLKRF
jgi:hypothetical protein